jgi:hypothetical protein
MKFMDSLVKDDYSFHNIPPPQKGCLGQLDDFMSYRSKVIGQDFCENLEAHIEEANRSILMNFQCLCTLWQQNNSTKVKAK